MKILKLTVENIKRIKAIEVTPQGNAVIISGKNGNGKSSTLDSIEMVFSGAGSIPSKPVREGESKARIVCETDKYIITRHWTSPTTSHLKLELKGEGILGSPQKKLDELVGDLSFDPLAFAMLESRDQLKMLKDLCKLDFTALDKEFSSVYDQRRDAAKEGEVHKSSFESFGDIEISTPAMSLDEIKAERDRVAAKNKEIEKAERVYADLVNNRERLNRDIEETNQKIVSLQEKLKRQQEELESLSGVIDETESRAQEVTEDLSSFDSALMEWTQYEANQKLIAKKKEADEKLQASRVKWKKLDDRLKEIEATKKKMISDANMPINGLSLGANEVLFNDMPFNQLSTSEQIRISMSIAMALNPRLRVVIIKNGSLLDKSAMDEVIRIASEKDFQVWIEKVAEGPEKDCIYIEDGEQVNQSIESEDEDDRPEEDAYFDSDRELSRS